MKLGEYGIQDLETLNFADRVREVINFGKYQIPVVTSVPAWQGSLGEFVLYRPTSGGTTQYFYAGTAWVSTWSVTI